MAKFPYHTRNNYNQYFTKYVSNLRNPVRIQNHALIQKMNKKWDQREINLIFETVLTINKENEIVFIIFTKNYLLYFWQTDKNIHFPTLIRKDLEKIN